MNVCRHACATLGMEENPRTKGFLVHQPRVFWGLLDDGRVDEEAGLVVVLAAHCDLELFLLDVGKKALDTLVLHWVLDGAKEDAFFVALADLERLGEGDHSVAELVEDLLVHEDAFDRDADL
jgi:hypothetical protein